MTLRNAVIYYLDKRPQLKAVTKTSLLQASRAYHALMEASPALLQPATRQITMAITASVASTAEPPRPAPSQIRR